MIPLWEALEEHERIGILRKGIAEAPESVMRRIWQQLGLPVTTEQPAQKSNVLPFIRRGRLGQV